jgi:type IV pilus assembly protein PilQ
VEKKAEIEPFQNKDTIIEPLLAGIRVLQLGEDTVIVHVRGYMIPEPRAVTAPGEGTLILQWDGARFPRNTDKRDWWDEYDWDVLKFPSNKNTFEWWKQYDLPLLNRINASPFDVNSMRLTFTTAKPMVLDGVDGIPGSDAQTLRLRVYKEPDAPKPEKPPVTYAKGDPMGIVTPIDVKFADANIKDVFSFVADIQNLNLLMDPSVPDMSITLSFRKAPYNVVFGYLLRMTNLQYSITGNTLVLGTPESLSKTLGILSRRAYPISYAVNRDGVGIRSDLVSVISSLVSLPKDPVVDERNRVIYVEASPEQHEQVAELLKKLDQPGKQIMIEARIVMVQDNATQQLQALVGAVYQQWLAQFTTAGGSIGYNWANVPIQPLDPNLPLGGSIGGDVVLGDITIGAEQKVLTAGLNEMELQGKTKTLASPSVIAIDGVQAVVDMRTSMRYPSGTDANGNIDFEDVSGGPMLTFTPVLGRNGMITIDVNITAAPAPLLSPSGVGGVSVAQTSERRVTTQVRVRDGEPFVVGGLFDDQKTKSRTRLPVIGYIPLLGDLFSIRNDTRARTEVAMIVIPHILNVPDIDAEGFDLMESSLRQ